MYDNVSTKIKVSSCLTSRICCERPFFHIGMGSSLVTQKFHEEHNDIFLFEEFACKSHSNAPKWPLRKFRFQCERHPGENPT